MRSSVAILGAALAGALFAPTAGAQSTSCSSFRGALLDQSADITALHGPTCRQARSLATQWLAGLDQNTNQARFECAPPPGGGTARCSFGAYRCRSVATARGENDVTCSSRGRVVGWHANLHPSSGPY